MKTKVIKIADIVIDAGTQQRVNINEDIVAEYSEAMKCGNKFPAVTVFSDGVNYYLADGFHRLHAHRSAEILEIEADIHDGTLRNARFKSLAANKDHGLRRSQADKKKAVLDMVTDKEWGEWTSRDIANHIGVSHTYVNNIRNDLERLQEYTGNVARNLLEPALNRDDEEKLSTGYEENNRKLEPEPDENEQIILELKDTVVSLDEENTRLKDAIASNQLPTDIEIQDAAEIISNLRSQIRTLEAELRAVKDTRDSYLIENGQLKSQLTMQRNQLKKLGK